MHKNLPSWLKTGAQLVYESRSYHSYRRGRTSISIRIISVLEVNSSRVKYQVKDYFVDITGPFTERPPQIVEGKGEFMVFEHVTPLGMDICEYGWFVDCELGSMKTVKGSPTASGAPPRSLIYMGEKVINTSLGPRKCWILKEERLKNDFKLRRLVAYDIIARVKVKEKSTMYWSNYLNEGPLEDKNVEKLVGTNFTLDQSGFLAKVCLRCGSAMPSNAVFCGICGKRLDL